MKHKPNFRHFAIAMVTFGILCACGLSGCGTSSVTGDADVIAGDLPGDMSGDSQMPDSTADDGSGDTGGDTGGDSVEPGPFEWPVQTEDVYITPSADWKNQVEFPDDPFLGGTGYVGYVTPVPRWIKFAVLMKDPAKVYFQDSSKYEFHQQFATERLDPFKGMTTDEFSAVSLYEKDQQVILGAVLYAPGGKPSEVGIQLVRMDPYHPEMVRRVFETVSAAVTMSGETDGILANPLKFFYFPTFEQHPSAMKYKTWLAERNVIVSSVERWATGSQCYSDGWAVGRLAEVAGSELDAAYVSGDLLPTDIVLTDAVPAEVPFVAGIITATASTPNSHVALLADALDIPFAWLALPADLDHARSLVGKRVAMWTTTEWDSTSCQVHLLDASSLTDDDLTALLGTKSPGKLQFKPKQKKGAYSTPCDEIGPADIVHFGGKAANYGILRDAIPDGSLYAIAFSFDLWDDFMGQPMTGGTLGQAIAARLAAHAQWPADIKTLDADLAAVRGMITDAPFPADLQTAVKDALAGFDASTKLRFRSSTNVEDSTEFSGAGLYDSFSGCLGDDLDADSDGPSHCDGAEAKERGVFRAIKKVYASFFNRNAFLERLRRQVDESKVGMGLLVHYSFPDAQEMANGVAIYKRDTYSRTATLVTQLGALSVANPEGGALPEIASVYAYDQIVTTSVTQESTLVPIGGRVMTWDSDYTALFSMIEKVEKRWEQATGRKQKSLDLEYKRVDPGMLRIKQVREVPDATAEGEIDTYLIGGVAEWCTFQGEYGDVYGTHRVKARATIQVKSGFVKDFENGAWMESIKLEFAIDGQARTVERQISGQPDVTWTRETDYVTVAFQTGQDSDVVSWRLTVTLPTRRHVQGGPFISTDDLAAWSGLEMKTGAARPWLDWEGNVTGRDTEVASLHACGEGTPVGKDHIRIDRRYIDGDGHQYDIGFWWPPAPTGITAGYTAPLVQWEQTVLTGFTTEPITLTGWWSRSQRPGHHNFSEDYAFEPRLEAGLAPATLAELEEADIAVIYYLATYPQGDDPAPSGQLCIEHLDKTMTCGSMVYPY
ncbi:MAG TPA: PEP/pyruvate-binding domain-containing protein [Myxococcota bacterium]|nr:PEP/pyruvate-binding domain-containing protein [Myxococcota bacterium]